MTFLASNEREQRQTLQVGGMGPGTFEIGGPAAFEGFGTASALSVGRAAATVGGFAYELGKMTPGYKLQREVADLFGKGEALDALEAIGDQAVRDAIDYYRPDPATTGWAGQVTYGAFATLLPAFAGGAVAGPLGAAALAGGSVGTGTFYDMTGEGVDRRTALGAAGIDAAATAVGVFMPASLGAGLLAKVTTGAAMNVGVGMGQRYAMGEYMRNAGYGEIAARYDAMDAMAIATDAFIGAGAGAIPSVVQAVFGRDAAPQAVADAAMVQRQVRHAEVETAPGIPANVASLNQHVRATDQATAQLLSGRDVDVESTVRGAEFVPRPDMPVEAAAIARALDDLGYSQIVGDIRQLEAELQGRGLAVADEALPEAPRVDVRDMAGRRVEDSADVRLATLRQRLRTEGRLPEAEANDLAALLEADSLKARVAGRAIPGVRNMKAYAEAEDGGSLKAVQAFADADNFKRFNDELGHDVGDQVISQMGALFAEALGEGSVFHRGGDEFIMQAGSKAELDAALTQVRDTLAQAEFRVTLADGTVITRKGVGFSYGAGDTVKAAEDAQYADKEARKAAGLRTDRNAPDAGGADRRAAGPGNAAGEGGAANPAADLGFTAEAPLTPEKAVEGLAAEIAAERPDAQLPASVVRAVLPDVGALTADSDLGRSILSLRGEIGWAQRGGQIVRDGPVSTDATAGADFGRATGDVVGRTSWEPKARLDGQGESTLWRDRPVRISEADAYAALDKFAAGEKLTKRERAFIGYMGEVSARYDAERAADAAEYQAGLLAAELDRRLAMREETFTLANALAAADETVDRATIDSAAYQAAVNCFLRNG